MLFDGERDQEEAKARAAKDMASIKARAEAVRQAIARGDPEVRVSPFPPMQLGMRAVYADERGRLWRDDGDRYVLLQGLR